MQISPLLLKNYHEHTCTPEERAMVEQWLLVPEDGITAEVPLPVKTEMWAAIHQSTLGKAKRAKMRMRYYPAAAACLLLGVFMAAKNNPMLFSRKLTIDNTSAIQSRLVTMGNLQFRIQPRSHVTLEMPLFGKTPGNVSFCGAVSVVNTAGAAANLHFNSDVINCADKPGSDIVSLRKGQTYMVMTDRDYNMISATKEELLDGIPRSFSLRLSERFKL